MDSLRSLSLNASSRRSGRLPGLNTIRGRLMLLTLALVVPAIAMAGVLLWSVQRQAHAAVENQLVETTRALSLVVDRQIGQQAAVLAALSTSPSLKAGDWAAFHAQAREAAPDPNAWIVVADGRNQQLANTRVAYGAPLPLMHPTPQNFSWAGRQAGGSRVSNLFTGPVAKRPVVVVMQPAVLNDGRRVQLAAVMDVSQFEKVFADQNLPATWTGSVVDATQSLVARSRDGARLVGRKASADMRAAIATHSRGVVKTQTLDGVLTYSAYNTLPGYGWGVIVGVPRTEMAGAARQALFLGAGVGFLLLALGLALAATAARAVVRPIEGVAAAARAAGPGRTVGIPATGIREVDDLAQAFSGAVETIAAREADLRESEERFRLASEDAPVMLWISDAEGGCLYLNRALREFWGAPETFADFRLESTFFEGDRDHIVAVSSAAHATGAPFQLEARYYRADGEVRTLTTRAVPRKDGQGRFLGMIGVNADVTDARRAEQHQRLLINELNHRVKNTLATVQSIAHQTLPRDQVAAEARNLLTSRLLALSAAHNVLTRENWESAALAEIVREAIRPYEATDRVRFEVTGPVVRLEPGAALALSMALHELATNAAKYGALSNAAGRVSIHWRLEGGKDGVLTLEWRERGGPPVSQPKRRGFGSRLLQQGLMIELGGAAEVVFEREGLVCTIRARLTPPTGAVQLPASDLYNI